MRSLRLFVVLFFWCFLLLWALGDFTGDAWTRDSDVVFIRSSWSQQVLWAAVVGVFFAAATATTLAITGWFWLRLYLLRLFLSLLPPYLAVVFFFGNFKTLLGGGDDEIVFYELPLGRERLLISLACGMLLALVTAVVLSAIGINEPVEAPI